MNIINKYDHVSIIQNCGGTYEDLSKWYCSMCNSTVRLLLLYVLA